MGLGLTNFALEGGVSGRTSLKIEGKGNSEMTRLSAYSSKNNHASVHCPARLHLLSPFPLPRSPACSTRVPPASRRHWSHLAWSSTMLCPARLHGRQVGANLPGRSSLWCRPSFSWSPAAAPLWFIQRTTPAGAAQLRLMPHCDRRHLIPPPHLPGRGLEVL